MAGDKLGIWTDEDLNAVIANSADHAKKILANERGYRTVDEMVRDIYGDDGDPEWQAWPDDVPFSLTEELENELDPKSPDFIQNEGEIIAEDTPEERAMRREEIRDASVVYWRSKDGKIHLLTRRELPAFWVAERGAGFLGCTDY